MKLNEITDNPGSSKARMRVGRGIGSGKGKQAGRGGKGQTARSGVRIKGFEGGQMPLHRRLPKRGFSNPPSPRDINEVNLGRVQTAIDAGKLDARKPVTVEALVAAGVCARARDGVKILGKGELKAKLAFEVCGGVEERRSPRSRRPAAASSCCKRRGRAARVPEEPRRRAGWQIAAARDHMTGEGRRGLAGAARPASRSCQRGARRDRSASMASAAEQLAANINWSAFAKADELKKRIWFTLGALIIYRLGTYIPLPGIDPAAFEAVLPRPEAGRARPVQHVLGRRRAAHGGVRAEHHALHLGLDHHPASELGPSLARSDQERGRGRPQGSQSIHALPHRAFWRSSRPTASRSASRGARASSPNPGMFFRISTVITLTGGTMFLVWLGEQITSRGVGNGSSLIIFSGIVARLPVAVANCSNSAARARSRPDWCSPSCVMALVVVAFIVFMERAQRRVPITYPRRQVGNKMYEGQSSFLPLKLNTSGVIPPIFASSLLLLPTTVANFAQGAAGNGILSTITTLLGRGGPLYLLLYVVLIVFFAFFYTATVLIRSIPRITSRSTAASFPASGRANARRNISTRSSPASR